MRWVPHARAHQHTRLLASARVRVTVTGSSVQIAHKTRNRIIELKFETGTNIENKTKGKIEYGNKIRIKTVTEIGMKSSADIKIKSGTEFEKRIGIVDDDDEDEDQSRNQKRDRNRRIKN
ncbi:hypothetical protein EVAR_52323_1 [Eumeta japonica]|uniref:Uncharacterized protein n=1 Tax=Eumeta variegata TaxID=151549 RepID=A0A4C1Y5S0_EUMVA|nr:hypothetical protein EVAR_52323_1 [Eumeta japonica]